MSEEKLPQKVDPFRFADNAIRLQGVLYVNDLERLCDYLHKHSGEIRVDLTFGKNEQGIRFLTGKLSGHLQLQCQRCMEDLAYEITNKIWLAIVHTEEEAAQLPSGYDAIIVDNDILVIQDMIEDELIVSLPVVPMHHPNECKVTLPLVIKSEQELETGKNNPFNVIDFLRVKQETDKK